MFSTPWMIMRKRAVWEMVVIMRQPEQWMFAWIKVAEGKMNGGGSIASIRIQMRRVAVT